MIPNRTKSEQLSTQTYSPLRTTCTASTLPTVTDNHAMTRRQRSSASVVSDDSRCFRTLRDATAREAGWMQSKAVAKLLGVKTNTLKKWRGQGKGPKGWKRVAPTVVMYPVAEVNDFQHQWGNNDYRLIKEG
jgi:hypothetical protein